MRVRNQIMVGMAVLLALAGAACGARPAAAAPDALRLLTWAEYVAPELLAKFERETGIRIVLETVVSVNQMRAALEANPGRYDVANPADYEVPGLARAGRLEPIDAPALPGYTNILDGWRSPPYDPRNEHSIPFHWGTTSVVVDTDVYDGETFSLDLLFAPPPELKDRVGFLIGAEETLRMALLWLGLPQCTSDRGHLERAAALVRPLLHPDRIYDIASAVAVLSGDRVAVGIAWNGDALRARERKPSLRYLYPREGLIIWSDTLVVPKDAPNRAGALSFLDFVLRPENAAIQSNFTRYANAIRGSDRFLDPILLDAPEVVIPSDVTIRFFRSCDSEQLGLYSELWDPLLKGVVRRDAGP